MFCTFVDMGLMMMGGATAPSELAQHGPLLQYIVTSGGDANTRQVT